MIPTWPVRDLDERPQHPAITHPALAAALAGRVIDSWIVEAPRLPTARVVIARRGRVEYTDDLCVARFNAPVGTHEVDVPLEASVAQGNGITVRIRFSGWDDLRYIAIGFVVDGVFRHVKTRHALQGEWFEQSFSLEDLAYKIQTDWSTVPSSGISEVRIHVNARPGHEGGRVDVDWVSAWHTTGNESRDSQDCAPSHDRALAILKQYLAQQSPSIDSDVRRFLIDGTYPILPSTHLEWPVDTSIPPAVESLPTYRYAWHSLYPAAFLMLHAEAHGSPAAHAAAVRLVGDWLARSYYAVDLDPRYAWYDHGTAERLLTILVVRSALDKTNSDHRLRQQLDDAIVAHGLLLESESFYAANQRYRFHNHALFQDLALLAAGALVPSEAAARWIATAKHRIVQQLDRLVCQDGDYAVFVENSTGYHLGIVTMMACVADMFEAATGDASLRALVAAMSAWSERLRYSDRRCPATGDTFRKPNHTRIGDARGRRPAPLVTVLPRAGYAIVDGESASISFTLCFFATSLSSTHKHEDNLSITLFFDDVEWLIDPSFHSHEYTAPIPAYLRSARAHNVVTLDGHPYSIEPGHAHLSGTALADDSFELRGEHSAYENHIVSRRITGRTNQLAFTVRDTVAGPEQTSASLVLHLGEDVAAEVEGTTVTLTHPISQRRLVVELPGEPEILRGWNEAAQFGSVSGTALCATAITTTVRVPFTAPSEFTWNVAVS